MYSFFKAFNNREIAITFWLVAFLGYLLFNKGVRKSIISLIKTFFSLKLQVVFLSIAVYVYLILYLLALVHFWKYDLLKDTIFWFFGVAFLLVFKITDKVDTALFKKTIKDSWKLTIFIEFILNLYVFSLPVELIITLIILLLSMMQPFTERDKKYKELNGYITKILSLIGIVFLFFALYQTATQYKDFLSWENIRSILLPPILTLLYIPFLYLLAVIFQYELLFVRIKMMSKNNKPFYRHLKLHIFKTAKLSLKKINAISSWVAKVDLHTVKNIPSYLNSISKLK